MSEQWYAVFDSNGTLVSTGTVIDKADLVAKGFSWRELQEDPTGKHWDGVQFRSIQPPYPGLSTHDFKTRFTPAERQKLLRAATPGLFGYDVQVHDFLDMLHTMAAERLRVDPHSNFVQNFLTHAVNSKYLTQDRAENIGAR